MTYSTLASIVKYPFSSIDSNGKNKFGFFVSEKETYARIAENLGITPLDGGHTRFARHPLVYLVEAADDICYQVMDIEDAYKLKILTNDEVVTLFMGFFEEHRQAKMRETFKRVSDSNEQIAYLRAAVIGLLTKECTRVFVECEEQILRGTFEGSLIKHISERPAKAYTHCAKVALQRIYRSKDVLDVELAGFRIITMLLDLMIEAVNSPEKAYSKLLIDRVSPQYNLYAQSDYARTQAVIDYISGMTDVYALDLYRKIQGNSLPAV